jgi:hypothetical protein
MTLSNWQSRDASITSIRPAHAVLVESRKTGDNVFNYDDRVSINNGPAFSRAVFTYYLGQDPAPVIQQAIEILFPQMSNDIYTIRVVAPFDYRLLKYGTFNTVEVNLHAKLMINRGDTPVYEQSYEIREEGKYWTDWTTFPSSRFMDTLFQKALARLLVRIEGDKHSILDKMK